MRGLRRWQEEGEGEGDGERKEVVEGEVDTTRGHHPGKLRVGEE